MTIDSISVDLESVYSLNQWLDSKEGVTAQRQLEEKITNILFSHDPSSPAFKMIAAQLAWIGSRPEAKPLLEKEIQALNDPLKPCSWFGDVASSTVNFVKDHWVEIAIGTVIVATGVGIALATGYTMSVAVGGVVVAGAGSIFQSEEKPNPHIPPIPLPDPKACSQAELAAMQQGLSITLPKIDLPSSANELLVTSNGV